MLLEYFSYSQLLLYNFVSDAHKYLLCDVNHLIFVDFFAIFIFLILVLIPLLALRVLVTFILLRVSLLSRRLIKVRLFVSFDNWTVVVS